MNPSNLWVVRCSDHDTDGCFGLFGAHCGQQTHPEHDVVQLFGVGPEARSTILQNKPCGLRVQSGQL